MIKSYIVLCHKCFNLNFNFYTKNWLDRNYEGGKAYIFLQSSVVDFQNFKVVGFYKMCSKKYSLLSFISIFSSFVGKKIIYV